MGVEIKSVDDIQKIVTITAEAVGILSTLALSTKKLVDDSKNIDPENKAALLAQIDSCIAAVSHMPSATEVKP